MLTDDAALAMKKSLLSETHGKSMEELERLLQDWIGCFAELMSIKSNYGNSGD